jgi:tetratricopeptide (TPR) repeat protein
MKSLFIFYFIFFPFCLCAGDQIKEMLAEKQKALSIAVSDQEKSTLNFELATLFYKDQEIDKAFIHFLEALKWLPKEAVSSKEEKDVEYQTALADYLAQAGKDPIDAAEMLLKKYGTCAENKKALNFLLATAYGNLGQYETFFVRFYQGYPYFYDTFLTHKTQGILYMRLFHHGKTTEEREYYEQMACQHLNLALQRNPLDASLYKIMIFHAKKEKNNTLVYDYMKKMVKHKVVASRSDILFYVQEAVALRDFTLGQSIIDIAKSHYEYSRALATAQEYLNQQRG